MLLSKKQAALLPLIASALFVLLLLFRREQLVDYYETTKQTLLIPLPDSAHGNNTAIGESQAETVDPSQQDATSESIHDQLATPSSGLANPPEDYLAVEQDEDEWCRSNFASEYLTFMAAHHSPYCAQGISLGNEIRGALECFKADDESDFCFAEGVRFNRTNEHRLEMNCALRNFTSERLKNPAYEKTKDITEFREEFFDTGAGPELRSWDIRPKDDDVTCTALSNDGKYYLYVRREGNKNLWHKLMELWQAMISVDALQVAINPKTNSPFLASSDVPKIQVVFTDDETGPVDDIWGLITGSPPIRRKDLTSRCMGNVIIPLAGSSSPFWKAHWDNKDCSEQFLLEGFLSRVYRYLEVPRRQRLNEETVVTIVQRKENRVILQLPAYVERLRQLYPSITWQVKDFAQMPLREQIVTMRGTDVFVGVIGAGMTNLLWLPKESSVAEILPPNNDYAGFRNLAKLRGLSYFTLHGQSESEWKETVAAAEAGELHDLAFQNEVEGSEAKVEEGFGKGKWDDWQHGDIFMTFEEFRGVVVAAVDGQGVRGLRKVDVVGAGRKMEGGAGGGGED